MKLIKPSFEIWEQSEGLFGIYKHIEKAGRVCYKSEDKITEDSAVPFINRLINSGHTSVLEHGTVFLQMPEENADSYSLIGNPYSIVNIVEDQAYITTNYRVIVETDNFYLLDYLCNPTEYHEKRITVKFICDRGVSHEFVRHRTFSFSQESTRYCNYSKDKFNKEITFIEPCWLEDYNYAGNTYYGAFVTALRAAESNYLGLLKKWEDRIPDKRFKSGFKNNPWTPQQARAVLPNALKTELVMTGLVSDWEHFFRLRCALNAHPQAKELAIPLREEFIKRGFIKGNIE